MKNILLSFIFLFLFVDSESQTNLDWIPMAESPNYQVYGLASYQGNLVTVGRFDSIGNLKANKIAKWNGSSWSPFGRGLSGGNFVFGTIGFGAEVLNNDLYVWGDFDSVETVAAGDIAKWNGTNWTSFGSPGTDGIIYTATIYNNELYIAGEFGNVGSLPTGCIAKWNGTNWIPMAINHSLAANYISSLCVYNNELYAAGYIPTLNGNPCHNIVKWNGSVWDTVAGGLPWPVVTSGLSLNEPKYAMTVWNGKLIVGSGSVDNGVSHTVETRQWNGTNWSSFSTNTYPNNGQPANAFSKVRKFLVRQNQLLASGGILPDTVGASGVYQWNQSTSNWEPIGHGPNYSVRALADYNGDLYCGGLFEKKQGSYFNYLAKLGDVTSLHEQTLKANLKIFPNPTNGILNLEFAAESALPGFINIMNGFGQIVYSVKVLDRSVKIDLSNFPSGIYFLSALIGQQQLTQSFLLAN